MTRKNAAAAPPAAETLSFAGEQAKPKIDAELAAAAGRLADQIDAEVLAELSAKTPTDQPPSDDPVNPVHDEAGAPPLSVELLTQGDPRIEWASSQVRDGELVVTARIFGHDKTAHFAPMSEATQQAVQAALSSLADDLEDPDERPLHFPPTPEGQADLRKLEERIAAFYGAAEPQPPAPRMPPVVASFTRLEAVRALPEVVGDIETQPVEFAPGSIERFKASDTDRRTMEVIALPGSGFAARAVATEEA